MQTQNIHDDNLINFSTRKNTVKKQVNQYKNIDNSNLFEVNKKPSSRKQSKLKDPNIISSRKQSQVKLKPYENIHTNVEMKKLSSRKQSQATLNLPITFYNNYFKYSIASLKNNLKSRKNTFNYIVEDAKFQNALSLVNTKKLNKDDINNIKFISYAKVKSKLFISQLIEDNNIDLFFSKNKEKIKHVIDILYHNKNHIPKKLSPIIEESSRGSSGSYKKKYGGNNLTASGDEFLSILAALDCKHDFAEKVNDDITKYVHSFGEKIITSKIKDAKFKTEINELFETNQTFEEDIMNNCILHILGNKDPDYLPDNSDFINFAFIDMNETATKLNIYEKLNITQNNTVDAAVDVSVADIHTKIIEYIQKFYRFNANPTNKYKYLLDTDLKLYDKFSNLDKRHEKLYDRIGKQLFPFENAFDPHSSNKIEIDIDDNVDDYINITNKIFNYPDADIPKDYKFAINKNVNKYFQFTINRDIATNTYYPCIIFRKYDRAKMITGGYLHINAIERRGINEKNELCKNTLMRCSTNLALFYINKSIRQKHNITFIENRGPSFNSIEILKIFIKKLIEILKSTGNLNVEMNDYLNINLDTDASITDIRHAIVHHMIAYIYYCYEEPAAAPGVKIRNIIEILFDLKKSGDWGQALFCSEYNNLNKFNNKECFFVTGDRLAAVRSILTNNVKTIFPIEYKLLSNINTKKKKSILALYRNNFTLTFQNFMEYINDNIFSLPAFETFKYKISPLFFMKQEVINQGKSEQEIITNDNFNKKTFEILVRHLYFYLYAYIYLYSIVSLEDDKIRNINYDEYERLKKEAIKDRHIFESDLDNQILKEKIQNEKNPGYNHFNLLYFLSSETLEFAQRHYITKISNIAEINTINTKLAVYDESIKKFTDTMKGIINEFNVENKTQNKFNTSKVLELFDKDFEKIVSFNIGSVDKLKQQLINISNLNETYSLLLCDDKFTNSFTQNELMVIDEKSITSIKRVFDDNNDSINNFFDLFSSIYSQPAEFKIFTKDIINSKLIELTELAAVYAEIKHNLDILREHIDNTMNDPNNTIVYLKSSFSIENTAFIQKIKDDFIYYRSNHKNEQDFASNQENIIDYNLFETTNKLSQTLYTYYSSIILQYIFISKTTHATQVDQIKKDNIAKALNNLYTNEEINDLFNTDNSYFTYNELYVKLDAAINKNNLAIEQLNLNLAQVYDTTPANDTIFYEFKTIYVPRVGGSRSPKSIRGSGKRTNGSSSGQNPGKKLRIGSPSTSHVPVAVPVPAANTRNLSNKIKRIENNPRFRPVRASRPVISDRQYTEKELKDMKHRKILALYRKLKTSVNGTSEIFYYNKDVFVDIIRDELPFGKFLKPNSAQNPEREGVINNILGDIGFIMYILTHFNNILNERTMKMFKTINKFFNVNSDNSELIKEIIDKKIKYYFNTNYIIIPIIYKYLKFIVEDKEKYIYNKSRSKSQSLTFYNIYANEHKHKIDKILYNMDILYNMTKNIVVA
jgi:hypothetical protein